MFTLENVWKIYEMDKGVKTEALRGVSMNINKGEHVALCGPSGSGKSTLMHIMGCLDTPTKGKVVVENRDVSKLSSNELAQVRREKIGFVFQAYNLIPGLNAIENVALPMRFNNIAKTQAEKKAKEILQRVGLEHRLEHKPNELSGGEQQRVSIARALANNPTAILADEPTGNLDSKAGAEIFDLLAELNKKEGKTILIVTHDINLAKKVQRRINIKDGRIVKGR